MTTTKAARAKPAGKTPAVIEAANDAEPMAFTFGDPEPVMNRREIMDHIECWRNGRWYEPPVSFDGLTRALRSGPHHESALRYKVNQLAKNFIPHPLLSRDNFKGIALDYCVLANAFLERIDNVFGRPIELKRSLARYTRRGVVDGEYFFLSRGALGGSLGTHDFRPGSICHLLEPDLSQEIYGVPEYLGALQSALLNESATIFRRRYYINGSHAGYILYMTDAAQTQTDVDSLRKALKESKGPGNFRNLFMYSPGGKKDGLQVIPVSDAAAKDEFLNIKNVSRDDVLAAHRVPPQLLGVVPANAGGFGDVSKAADVFHINEIEPLQTRFLSINEWIGIEVVRFSKYVPLSKPANDNEDDKGPGRRPA